MGWSVRSNSPSNLGLSFPQNSPKRQSCTPPREHHLGQAFHSSWAGQPTPPNIPPAPPPENSRGWISRPKLTGNPWVFNKPRFSLRDPGYFWGRTGSRWWFLDLWSCTPPHVWSRPYYPKANYERNPDFIAWLVKVAFRGVFQFGVLVHNLRY